MFHGGDMNDIMAAMLGGMGGMGGAPRRRKGRDIGHAMPVRLEDLYNGKTVELPREKDIICPGCQGKGSSNPRVDAKCAPCRGQGVRMMMRQMGPMITQQQVPCDSCGGTGMKIDEKDKCKQCQAKRIVTKSMPLSVKIEPGMKHQQQIPFVGEGDQHPDIDVPGAIVVVLQQIKHDKFEREENDLVYSQSIPLVDAVCGFQFVIEHLDGRKLVVRNEPGQAPIKPGDQKCIIGEGMPIFKRPGQFGDLIIKFEVAFPARIDDSQVDALCRLLAQNDTEATDRTEDEDAEIHYVDRQPLEDIRKEIQQEDDDDDDAQASGSGGGIQCASH